MFEMLKKTLQKIFQPNLKKLIIESLQLIMKKPRHNPDKPQNNYNPHCSYWEDIGRYPECYIGEKCQGLRHNCSKSKNYLNAIERKIRRFL